ncbi:MAG: YbaB/EbfC family nucleoid-associated protein [Alphaproteobacteria bacterium]|nr:YbaB/EbfC family nucleoid-associated protein [Alphaproteobacteria bacterium]
MKDLSDIMRQAQEMQARLAEAQERMDKLTADGAAGGGLVTVRLKGKGELDSLKIDPSLLAPGEAEILEDLLKAAHADARRKLDDAMADAMRQATGGMSGMMPGFKLPF